MSSGITVSICCLAFNHEIFIKKCLDGFLSQQCDFGFEILIHDDASTDGTAEIIRQYELSHPNIIKPIYQTENQFSKGIAVNRIYNFKRAQGKYIALCEGDDYWTDPLKLQKQVDFLEANAGYTLVCGGFKIYDTVEGQELIMVKEGFGNAEDGQGFSFSLNDIKYGWLTKTMTSLFVNDPKIFEKLIPYHFRRDVHLFYHLLREGNGHYFKQVFGVYHVHGGGIFSSSKKSLQNYRDHYLIYRELFLHNKEDHHAKYMYKKALTAFIQNYLSDGSSLPEFKVTDLILEGIKASTTLHDYLSISYALIPPSVKRTIKKVIKR